MERCVKCGAEVAPLEVFPNGEGGKGINCLDCYAKSPAGRRPVSAEELAAMWGGPVRRSARKAAKHKAEKNEASVKASVVRGLR